MSDKELEEVKVESELVETSEKVESEGKESSSGASIESSEDETPTTEARDTNDHQGRCLAVMEPDNPVLVWFNYALFILGAFTFGLFSIAGVIMAHVNGMDGSSLDRDHSRFLQRTFWFGLLWSVLLSILFVVTIPAAMLGGAFGSVVVLGSWAIFWIVGLWYLYRVIKGAVFYSKGKCNYL